MSGQVSAIAEPMPENTRAMEAVVVVPLGLIGFNPQLLTLSGLLEYGLTPQYAEELHKAFPSRLTIREKATTPQIVLTLPLTPESREILEHPERFWVTSQSGVSFSKFAVDVREVG